MSTPKFQLLKQFLTKEDTTHTPTNGKIPTYDGNGSITCSLAITDEATGKNYVGGASPHNWVNDRLNALNKKFTDWYSNMPYANQIGALQKQMDSESTTRQTTDQTLQTKINTNAKDTRDQFNALTKIVNAKKITKITLEAGDYIPLKTNTLYAFLKDGSNNTCSIGLLDWKLKEGVPNELESYFTPFNSGTDDEITMKFGIVIIPENTQGASVEYPPSYYCVAAIDKTTLGVTTVSSKKFTVKKADLTSMVMEGEWTLYARENSGTNTFSVWELSL